MTRDEIQKKALKIIKDNPFTILEWGTGIGKSKAAIDAIKYLRKNNKKKILLVVAELAHFTNWQEELEKWGVKFSDIQITTYASLKNYRLQPFDFIIFDEGHHIGSDIRLDILSNLISDKILVLSATMPQETIYSMEGLLKVKSKVYSITLQEAIDYKILPEPKIYLVPQTLSTEGATETIVFERGAKSKRVTIKCTYEDLWLFKKAKIEYPNLTLIISATEKQKYDYINAEVDYYKSLFFRMKNEGIKNKWMQAGTLRKRYLGSLKDNKAKEIMHKLRDKRYVCFCSSVDQAILLGDDTSIHSRKKNSIDIIDTFNSKEIDTLFAVGMIQEGSNLVDIDAAIIVQLDGKERAFIQKSGRAMRAESPEIYIIYYKDTRDEEYLTNALEGLSKEYIIII